MVSKKRIKTLLIIFLIFLISVTSQVLADNYTYPTNFTTNTAIYQVPLDGMYNVTSIINFGDWLNITGSGYAYDHGTVYANLTILTLCDEDSDCALGDYCSVEKLCSMNESVYINNASITPLYANENEQLDCNFNTSTMPGYTINTTITWFNNSVNVNTYDYTYVNITQNITTTTTVGTGSIPANITNNYENWTCQIYSDNGARNLTVNTSIKINPLENLTIYSPIDNAQSTDPNLNVSFSVDNLDGSINCTLNVNNLTTTIYNISSGVTTYINQTLDTEGLNTYNINCTALGHPEGIVSTNRSYYYDLTAPTYTNYASNETSIYPQEGDIIELNVTVSDLYNIDTCILQINDTGSWVNESTYNINTTYEYNLSMEYTVPVGSSFTAYWRVICNDSAGLASTSSTQNYTIKDSTPPIITLNSGNGFSSDNTTIKTSFVENIDIDISFNDTKLDNASIFINCTKNGTLLDWSQTGISTTTYNYSSTVDLTGMDAQACEVTITGTDSNPVPNINIEKYIFYIGSYLTFSSLNRVDNGTYIDGYTVNVEAISASPDNNGTKLISGTTGFYTNLTEGTHRITITHPNYFTQVYLVNIENQTQSLIYDTFQAVLYVIPINTKSGDPLSNQTTLVTNLNTSEDYLLSEVNGTTATFYLNASDYNVFVQVPEYFNSSVNTTLTYQQNLTLQVNMNFIAEFLFIDERTNEPFNVSNADRIEFLMECPDDTNFAVLVTNETQSIPVPCNFSSFRVLVEYGTESYYRNFLFTPDDVFNISIYLIDLTNTDAVYTGFFLDDLLNEYDNPALHIKKVIGGGIVTITADYANAEDKVGTYLVKNHKYIIEVSSDNNPIQNMGDYTADVGGDKNLRLYSIDTDINPSNYISTVSHIVGTFNDTETNDTIIYAKYVDTLNATTSVKFSVYANSYKDNDGNYSGVLIFNSTVLNPYNVTFTFNSTAYDNVSLYGELEVVHPMAEYTTVKSFHVVENIVLGIFNHLKSNTVKWAFTLLLSIIAIMGTIKTANPLSILMLGISAFFVYVGWFELSWAIIFFALMISFLSMIRKGDKRIE